MHCSKPEANSISKSQTISQLAISNKRQYLFASCNITSPGFSPYLHFPIQGNIYLQQVSLTQFLIQGNIYLHK